MGTLNEGLFSSDSSEWETPEELFREWQRKYFLDLDVCATPENSKCTAFFTKEDNGLEKRWIGRRCWMNPPYGREIGKWVEKAANSNALVVALLPARTDTKWFHNFIYKKPRALVYFLKGRIKFVGAKSSAPFPSMIVVFNPQLFSILKKKV